MRVPGDNKMDAGPIPTSGLSGAHPPGTTPLVAMALMEMAVSKVQQQQMSTMRRACSTPAVPTIQVSRRKRMTPKIFCRQGRYTPMRVPMLGAYGASEEGSGETQSVRGAQRPHGRLAPSHSAVPYPQGLLPENRMERDIPSVVLGSMGWGCDRISVLTFFFPATPATCGSSWAGD